MALKVKAKKSALEEISEQLIQAEAALREYAEHHEQVLAEYRRRQDDKEILVDRLKAAARELAPEFGSAALIDSANLGLVVQTKYAGTTYDVEKARTEWPSDVYQKVITVEVDAKKVEAAVKAGLIRDEVANKAALPRKKLTASVTVDLR